MRRRLIHCQGRKHSCFQTRFAQIPQELEARPNKAKRNSNLIGVNNLQANRKTPSNRPNSLSDQNKTPRTGYTSVLVDKDHLVTKTRHTT